MLAYAYQTIELAEYKKLDIEKFHQVKDMYAEILLIGIPVLIRGGLIRDYVSASESSTIIKGQIDINKSIKNNSLVSKKLVITYDQFSEDILMNQIIKATMVFIVKSIEINSDVRKKFRTLLLYFTEVSDVELDKRLWNSISYNRQNNRYRFIIDICRYFFEDSLINESSASSLMHEIKDEQRLATLFEKFIFAFYKRETDYIVTRPQIHWEIDNNFHEALPIMQTDIVLKQGNKTLIMDTKFYSNNMISRTYGGRAKQISSNLYQVFSYVHNWKKKNNEVIGGMLLYARTSSIEQPNHQYHIKGYKMYIYTIDLNQDFQGIKNDLYSYAQKFFKENEY